MQYRSRFFYVWSLWSIIFGYMLFQSTVPMMEVLPEENIIFLLFLVITVFLFYKVRTRRRRIFIELPMHTMIKN